MLSDVPSFFGGFAPKNFNRGYGGAVNANQALSRSLNIPMVHLLKKYSFEQFHRDLNNLGITTLAQPAGHYGLSLILGGCEVTMWEFSQIYFSMFRKLTGDPNLSIHFESETNPKPSLLIREEAIWQTFQTMTHLARPEGERSWRSFNSSQLIVWKTGTSYGDRDAWAFGLNGEVLVAVWVGNADGEGRADLTGIKAAAYGGHFMEIGEKYGPFDLAMIECGQYNELWREIHMMPEETAQASPDLKARFMMPILGILQAGSTPSG